MQLHAAASRGDLEGMAFALNSGADANSCNSAGQTAIVFALERAKAFSRRCGPKVTHEAVKALLDAGADLEAADSLGATAIHHAVGIADPGFLGLLLKRGGNPRHETKSGYSVLLHACFQPASAAKRAIIERLHEAGASLDPASEYGEFPLGVCLYFGDFETLRRLMELGADPGPLNWSALHHAVALKGKADIERLAPSAADINALNPRFGLSPWLLGFIRGELGSIRYLAHLGADLTQVGRCGETILHLAAKFGNEAVTNWLLDLGADANSENEFGEAPLHHAAEWNHIACARELLGRGADTSHQNHVESQPIHSARSLEMIQLLVESGGADVNAIDGSGEWPLKSAAESNDVERIGWLLNHGADVDRTSTGETALHTAVRFDSREAVGILLKAGANPNAQDVDGWTPLFGALSREVVRTLRMAGADPQISDQIGSGPERWLADPILLQALRERI
ncbi:MAG TPA: ankyrin repeat domain-containing protein [Chthoniobacteraceae bacterium]|nr:ankyrin repeat domain-containing protein [Chthoniobacteraceae bacterium]